MSKDDESNDTCSNDDTSSFKELGRRLSQYLPYGEEFEINHVRTERYEIDSLYWGPLSNEQQQEDKDEDKKIKTTQEENLIVISNRGIQLYGIEIINYQILKGDKCLRTVTFVSKADTTGYYHKPNGIRWGAITTKILEYTMGLALENQSQSLKSVQSQLCLFARSEPQYIFPGSSFNDKKHILTGPGLIRWWCKAIDKICYTDNIFQNIDKVRLTVPGADRFTIESLIPKGGDWKPGDIYAPETDQDFAIWKALKSNDNEQDDKDDTQLDHDLKKEKETAPLAIDFIPAFPDDPKNRFLNDILASARMNRTSIARFWVEMAARQEFLLGELTAVIGVEGHYKKDKSISASSPDPTNVITHEVYNQLWTHLMDADYTTRDEAQQSSKNFVQFVENKCNGWYDHSIIRGENRMSTTDQVSTDNERALKRPAAQVNVLQVRKKPKKTTPTCIPGDG